MGFEELKKELDAAYEHLQNNNLDNESMTILNGACAVLRSDSNV